MERWGGIGGWLRITLLVLVAMLGALALAITSVALNPNTLKPIASFLTERLLGRTLVIGGDVTLELSLQPRATVREVRLSNRPGASHPDMVTAGYLLVQIDLLELLDRRVRLLDLDAQDAELFLEDPVGAPPNWAFGDADRDEAEASDSGWSLLIEGLEVQDSAVLLELGEIEPIEVRIPQLIESTDATGRLTLDGQGTFNGQHWQVQGRLGTFDALLAGGHIELELDLSVEDVVLSVDGSIGELARLSPLDLNVSLRGPDADLFGALFRMPEAFTGDVALEASVHPAGDLHRVAVDGHISQFSVGIEGTIRDLLAFDGWDGRVDVSGPDAGVIAKALQITTLPGGPFEVRGNVHRHGGDLDLTDVTASLSGADLTLSADFSNFPEPGGARVDAILTGGDLGHYRKFLRLPSLPDGVPFRAELTLDGVTDTLSSTITVGSHTLHATGVVGTLTDFDGTHLTLSASGDEAAELTRFAGQAIPLAGPYRARTVLDIAEGGLSATDIHLENDPVTVTGAVRVPDLGNPDRLSVDGSLDVDDLTPFREWLDVKGLPSGSLSVSTRISSDGTQWLLEQAEGRLVRLEFSVSGKLGTLKTLSGIDLRATARGPDINVLFDRALADASEVPFTVTSRVVGVDKAIDLQDFELQAQGGVLKADSRITLNEKLVGSRVSLTGSGPNLAHLVPSFSRYQPAQLPWQMGGTVSVASDGRLEIADVRVQVGSVRASATGVLDARNAEQTDLSLAVSGDAVNDIGRIGMLDWPDMPFSISAELDGSADAINISRLEARWGNSDLTATGSVDLTTKPHVVLNGSSSLLRIVEIQQAFPEAAGDAADTTRLIPDTPLPLDLLDRQDLDLSVAVGRFEGRRTSLDDVHLLIRIRDGALNLERIRYRDQFGFFDANGTVEPTIESGVARLTLNVRGEDADLGLFTAPDQPKETRPSYNIDVSITGTGTSAAEIAGNLDGTVLVYSEGGQISNSIVETYASDFIVNVLETLNPFTKSEPFTQVQCMVLNTEIEKGRINLQPGFVMRTNRLNMFVVGDVNLKTERLNLSLATQARQGIGISAATLTNPYFKVGGTLLSPQLQLDAQSATIAAGVTAATMGLSIVVRGVWSRLMGEQNPCPRFLEYKRTSVSNTASDGQDP